MSSSDERDEDRKFVDPQPLRDLVARSGLSPRQFVADVMAERGERSIRRWLNPRGEGAPERVVDWASRVQEVSVHPVEGPDPDLIDVTIVVRSRVRRPGPEPKKGRERPTGGG